MKQTAISPVVKGFFLAVVGAISPKLFCVKFIFGHVYYIQQRDLKVDTLLP